MASSKKHPALSGLSIESLDLAEAMSVPTELVRAVRQKVADDGAAATSEAVCATLTFLAQALSAKAVVEIGTGPGVSGLALFAGMAGDGVLTSIDAETDWQIAARAAFTSAGVASQRFRLIAGMALDVLPKLRDGAYDLVFVNGDKLEYVEYLAQAARLLRPGGVMVLNDVLWHNLTADRDNDDDQAFIMREALDAARQDDTFASIVIPLGDGLLVAAKR